MKENKVKKISAEVARKLSLNTIDEEAMNNALNHIYNNITMSASSGALSVSFQINNLSEN